MNLPDDIRKRKTFFFFYPCEAGWVTSEILRSKAASYATNSNKRGPHYRSSALRCPAAHTGKQHSLFSEQRRTNGRRGGDHRAITFPVSLLPGPTRSSEPRPLKWQPDKLVLKKPRGNQSTPLAHNYLSFNETISVLSESDRCKLGHAEIDSLVGLSESLE